MCTALTYSTSDHYFGRNLDLEYSYDERVTITPRNYPFHFRHLPTLEKHYAMIGMAYTSDGYPLYYEATNEKGLSIAGLNFPGNAVYKPLCDSKDNVAPFELIPWLLGQCITLQQTRELLDRLNIAQINFSEKLPASPLHWMISDQQGSIVLESVEEGLKTYDNPVGVMTNNPPFDFQLFQLNNYMHVTAQKPVNRFSDQLELKEYSLGMGGIGLPGDLSSMSRFVKAVFTRMNSISAKGEMESVSQFFHILGSVEQQRGCTFVRDGECEFTYYSSCCNMDKGIYYYRTYDNSQISAVNMHHENLEGSELISFALCKEQQIKMHN